MTISARVQVLLPILCSVQLAIPVTTFALSQQPKINSFASLNHAYRSPFATPAQDSGSLAVVDAAGKPLGKCPLQHTDVSATISGYSASVRVIQEFQNDSAHAIDAIYTFPLSHSGAVDEMTMSIGDRTIKGSIHAREEARKIYDDARRNGNTASLLDQERTNIFTQSVANIPPHSKVKIEIKYVELLSYESGEYEFVFPMVVGPRYIAGNSSGRTGTGFSPNTNLVPDGSLITPTPVAEQVRAGHDISLAVTLKAGMPVQAIRSQLHPISVLKEGTDSASIKLSDQKTIPNRDFVLKWKVASNKLNTGVLAHKVGDTGYFSLMIVPPERPQPKQIVPRELIFIVDKSGSQHGLPLQKAKETMLYILDRLNPNDTFQILSFSNGVEKLFDKPMLSSEANVLQAKKYIAELEANGGTDMEQAVREANREPAPSNRLRIFTIMTDGYVGRDENVIDLVKQTRATSRWFAFGTGNSVNRLLIDGVAKAGGGEAEYVLLNAPGDEVAKRFYERISSPVLTDIKLNFGSLNVSSVEPRLVNDVWAQRPVYLTGKYSGTVDGTVVLTGISGAAEYKQPIHIHLPGTENSNGMLPSLWARGRVNELMSQLIASHDQRDNVGLEQEIKQLGIQYHIMTKFTSFVAVDTSTRVTPSQETKAVPVETPNGVMLRQIFPSAAQPIRPTGLLKLPQEIGRVEGPRDMNMFQVEPTVIDERHYTSGRAERHQKTSPTLPEGSPIPDSASNFKTPDRSEQLPAPIESAPRLPYSEKLSAELLTLLSQATAPGKLVKLSIHLNSITPGSIAQLKKEGAKILSLSKSTKLITIEIQIGKLQRLIALPNIQRVQLVIK